MTIKATSATHNCDTKLASAPHRSGYDNSDPPYYGDHMSLQLPQEQGRKSVIESARSRPPHLMYDRFCSSSPPMWLAQHLKSLWVLQTISHSCVILFACLPIRFNGIVHLVTYCHRRYPCSLQNCYRNSSLHGLDAGFLQSLLCHPKEALDQYFTRDT